MNGDLSLSQSLGGLRIANPDDEARSPSSYSQPQTVPSPSIDTSHPSSHSHQDHPGMDEPSTVGSRGVDIGALGFNPTDYAAERQPFPAPHYSSPSARDQGQQLNHSHSTSLAQEIQTQPPYVQTRAYQSSSIRPASGIYHAGPVSLPESTYQRVRADSTQSASPTTPDPRRTHSRTALGETHAGRISNGLSPRQHSNSNPAPAVLYPPTRTSQPRSSAQDHPHAPNASTHTPPYTTEPGSTPNSDGGRDRGISSPGNATQPVDAGSKQPTKPMKKGVKDFNFGRTLGEGSYSTVLAATDRTTLKEYAIKVLDKKHIIKERKVKYVNIERDTLNRLTDHPGIVRLYYTFQDDRSLYFVLDLATGGELLGVLKKMTTFDEECSRFYAAQILDAIEYMHMQGIIHRDIKPENVLLDDQMHVKITDFGTAKILDLSGAAQFGKVSVTNDPLDGADTDRAVSFVGTAEYVSPELLTDKNACKASDLWAFGCIVYQLLAGRPPFKAGNEYQTFQKIVNLNYSFPDGFPPVARDLITKLLVLAPGERLPTDMIKRHPFFDGIQWGKGLWKQKAPKLRSYNPHAIQEPRSRDLSRDALSTSFNPLQSKSKTSQAALGQLSTTPPRPQPRLITELAPPSQLDIDWSPVLTKANERIIKLGQLVVYSSPAPRSPTSKTGSAGDTAAEGPSKISRFFGGNATKKRQRLVMVTSGARLVLAPSGGDRKEAKQIVNLADPDVSWKSQQDAKGYTVWCVFTREKHLTFEDTKANTGDSGSSMRSTQEWLDIIQEVRNFAPGRRRTDPFPEESMNGLGPSLSNVDTRSNEEAVMDETQPGTEHRRTLRKGQIADDDASKGRKRFSKRHSKNGLAAVF